MRKEYLIDTNSVIDYLNNKLPNNAYNDGIIPFDTDCK